MNVKKRKTKPEIFATVPEAMEIARLGRKTVMKVAESSGALLRIGRSVRIDLERFEEALRKYQG